MVINFHCPLPSLAGDADNYTEREFKFEDFARR